MTSVRVEVGEITNLLQQTLSSLIRSSQSQSSPATPTPTPTLSQLNSINLDDHASTSYITSLLSLPLSTLTALPASLSSLSSSLDSDLASLAFTRYSSFLLSHSATQAINSSFSTLSDELSSLLDSTSALESAAGAFEQRVHQVRRKRDRMGKVRERIDQVEELLEAPAVVDACVKAGYWAEALDVATRLTELHHRLPTTSKPSFLASSVASKRHSSQFLKKEPFISEEERLEKEQEGKGALLLLNRVREDVSIALLSLRARVLASLLQRSLKLPGAVRGISILRRINSGALGMTGGGQMDEESLRVVFLAARWKCLRGELDGVEAQLAAIGIKLSSDEDAPVMPGKEKEREKEKAAQDALIGPEENEERTRWIKRWIDVWREVVGETVGMYSDVFLSASSTNLNSPVLSATAPLSLFLSTALTSLSTLLTASLPCLTSPASLSSLLTQLSYCSHAFIRHGLDFSEFSQIRARIEHRVGKVVIAEWVLAGRKWEKEWRDGWEGGIKRRGRERKALAQWLVVPEGLSVVLGLPIPGIPPPSSHNSFHHLPNPLLSYLPPLARFLNAQATALNALRLLPSPTLYPLLREAQARELDRAVQVLAAFVEAFVIALESQPSSKDSDDEPLTLEERQAEELKMKERDLIVWSIAAFGRLVIPWCESALRLGVYNELMLKGDIEMPRLVKDAMVKAEALVARLTKKDTVVEVMKEEENAEEEEEELTEEGREEEVVEGEVAEDLQDVHEPEEEQIADDNHDEELHVVQDPEETAATDGDDPLPLQTGEAKSTTSALSIAESSSSADENLSEVVDSALEGENWSSEAEKTYEKSAGEEQNHGLCSSSNGCN